MRPIAEKVRGITTPSTGVRWGLRGVVGPDGQRVRLEIVRVGNRIYTSSQAVARFLERLQPCPVDGVPTTRSPAARRRSADAAATELERLGV